MTDLLGVRATIKQAFADGTHGDILVRFAPEVEALYRADMSTDPPFCGTCGGFGRRFTNTERWTDPANEPPSKVCPSCAGTGLR